ncbi:hypothetical protein PC39_11492 [Salinisphaera sp. PC39]|uniref:DUF1329 domain-containing protein n=1 Tax=Salinisphaera sp. PC39 TaxID=1304156 RepID=UPI00333FD6CD
MQFRSHRIVLAGVLAAFALGAQAKVPEKEAAKLGNELTPLGAKRAGNADGTIPAWDGGITAIPEAAKQAGYTSEKGARLVDPFPDDEPRFTITNDNLDQYRDKLTPGQIALFERFEDYKMPVYQTRRTAANDEYIYKATRENATRAELVADGEGLEGAAVGIPFPIPQNGREVIWNHKVRYRGVAVRRWNNQFPVTSDGDFNAVKLQEDVFFPYSAPGTTPEQVERSNVIIYFLQVVRAPARLAGQILLVHDTANQVREPRRAWLYNPGQRRVRRAPNVAYDNPGTASDGLRTNDQLDMFNGAMDRYTWKLEGKREIYVPYNAYRLHSGDLSYDDIFNEGHIDQDLTRYELHRVWVVDSFVREGTSHIYKRRTYYVDEDSWQILAVDAYDQRDQLWRVQEAHPIVAYDPAFYITTLSAGELVYDLQNERYLGMAFNNDSEEVYPIEDEIGDPARYFNPRNIQRFAFK